MRISLRNGGPGDSAVCWEIYARAVREGAGPHYSAAQRRAWVPETSEPAWLAERLAAGRTWIAEVGGAPVGSLPVGFLTAAGLGGPADAHLDLFFTLPRVRGTGVAPALYAAFAAAAGAAGQGACLTAFASLHLRPFLERRGWRMLRPDPSERGGEVLMRYVMEKRAP